MSGNISTRQAAVKSAVQIRAEERIAALAGRRCALLAPRATTALVALLRVLDLPSGSGVLLPATLCANPAHAVRLAGLRPVFADISHDTLALDLLSAEQVVGEQTKVLLAVPLFGQAFDVEPLLDFARRHGLIVVEDAAHAVGVRYGAQGERPGGSLGVCSIYSFGAGKIADAGGGAALMSDDPALLERARFYLAQLSSGQQGLDRLATRILDLLRVLPTELQSRSDMARLYRQALALPGITHPQPSPLWKYSVLLPNRSERDRVTRALLSGGVAATNLYPPLPHFFGEAQAGSHQSCPAAWDVYNRIVNLPLWPQPEGLFERVQSVFTSPPAIQG